MRLIHTADWHLGQTFHEYDRAGEHQAFLDWLLETLGAERADALLVAGDVFDHANPSAASQRQLYRFLGEARRRYPRLDIVLVAGNHDSPGRLEAPSPLLDPFDVTVVGHVTRRGDGSIEYGRLCVPLRDAEGQVAAWCLAAPFLRSADVPCAALASAGVPSATTVAPAGAVPLAAIGAAAPAAVVDAVVAPDALVGPASTASAHALGVARFHQDLLAEALRHRAGNQAIVVLAHCHVERCSVTAESERAVIAGGLDALSRHIFDPRLAYVALGHLHRPQALEGDDRIRYAGSPLPLSFSEVEYPHQVVRVDLEGVRLAAVTPIRVPRFVPLLRVPQKPAPVEEVLAALRALDLPQEDAARQPYLEVRLCLDGPEPGLRARVDEALADKPVRLARIETFCPLAETTSAAAGTRSADDLSRLTPVDVFRQLHRDRFGHDVPADLLAAFGDLLRSFDGGDRR